MAKKDKRSHRPADNSTYDLRGRMTFGTEPNWLRLTLWLSLLVFYLAIAYLLIKYANPVSHGNRLENYLLPLLAIQTVRPVDRITGWLSRKRKAP
jgi:hypothetical protein